MFFFFFNDTATTEIYTLSLHDALPIWRKRRGGLLVGSDHGLDLRGGEGEQRPAGDGGRAARGDQATGEGRHACESPPDEDLSLAVRFVEDLTPRIDRRRAARHAFEVPADECLGGVSSLGRDRHVGNARRLLPLPCGDRGERDADGVHVRPREQHFVLGQAHAHAFAEPQPLLGSGPWVSIFWLTTPEHWRTSRPSSAATACLTSQPSAGRRAGSPTRSPHSDAAKATVSRGCRSTPSKARRSPTGCDARAWSSCRSTTGCAARRSHTCSTMRARGSLPPDPTTSR